MIDKDIEYMLLGKVNRRSDEKIRLMQLCENKLKEFNNSGDSSILQNLFGSCGDVLKVRPPFYCDYGKFIEIGYDVYINTNCIILDACKVKIGDHVMIGPRVSIFSATHPIDPIIRTERWYISKPVTIGNYVWIGGNTTINPGITIGDKSIIGSGSVVTHDIPCNVIAAGNPCKIIREITKEDYNYWYNKCKEYKI